MRGQRTPAAQGAQGDSELDRAGQTIVQLINKAADVTEQKSRRAIDTAQKLSHQLRTVGDRIAQLEAELAAHQERAERAEHWLNTVYVEIEDRFLNQEKNGARRPQ
jgi:predicted  nucleic acid-binding Zn-ribbon protein